MVAQDSSKVEVGVQIPRFAPMPTNNPKYQKAYHRKHYLANKKKYVKQAREQKDRLVAIARAIKSRPCVDCNVQYAPWIMQFDHVRGKKVADVSTLAQHGSEKAMLEEIEKCDVVCANCHADRTHRRRSK